VKLIVFPGAFNWPVWVAQDLGFFAKEGIEVDVSETPGSVFQFTQLIEGRADLAITLADNVVAYREGQGEVPIVGPDLVALMASDTRVFPSLITAPEIKSYQDLKGKTLSVDATKTGYANVLLAMLEAGGLAAGEYTIASVGGVKQRFEGLLAGQQAGALFNSPFESLLVAQGYNLMDTAASIFKRYQGQVLAARSSWANANRDQVTGFIRAFLAALAWLYEPGNREEAYRIFSSRQADAGPGAAKTAYQVLFHADTGFPRDGKIDPEGFKTVIDLRARFGIPKKKIGNVGDYIDTSFCEDALG